MKRTLKSTGVRYFELFRSMQIIQDCLSLIEKGKKYHIITIAGQLRGIFTADRKAQTEPLFFEAYKILWETNNIYIKPLIDFEVYSKDSEICYKLPIPSLQKTDEYTNEISLQDWITKINVVKSGDKYYTILDFIKVIADKKGGAHYDESISKNDAQLVIHRGENGILSEQIVIELARIVIKLGHKLLKNAFDFHYYQKIKIDYEDIDDRKNIILFKDDKSWLGLGIVIDKNGTLWLNLIEDYAVRESIILINHVSKQDILTLNFSYNLKEDMTSEVRVYDERWNYYSSKLAIPVLVINSFYQFKDFYVSDEGVKVFTTSSATLQYVATKEEVLEKYKELESRNKNWLVFKGLYKGVNQSGIVNFDKQPELAPVIGDELL